MNLKEALLGKQLPIQYRFYNLITLLYAVVGIIAFAVCTVFRVNEGIQWGTLMFSVVCLIFCCLAKVTEKYNLWATLFYICINCVLMPIAYLNMGGIGVGADVWIITSIVLGVFTLSRRTMYVLLGVVFVVYAGLFYLVYRHPEYVWTVRNQNAAIFIVAVSVIIAAVGISLMVLYQWREYEAQLRLNDVKEKELERLIDELQKSKALTARVNVAKTNFLKSMSEGIHAPLALLLEKGEEITELEEHGETKHGMEITSAGKAMAYVIANIVDLSMIESGEFSLRDEVYSLKEELREVYDIIKIQADKKDLRLIFDINPHLPNYLRGDIGRLRQIIINLLSNGVQYTSVGEVRLHIDCENVTEKTIRINIRVSDTGIGIKEENLASVFYRFNADEKELHTGLDGVGLGLTVSNQILQLMGSKLEVESEYGQGTVFSFSIIQRIENWESVGEGQQEEEKDSYEELLAFDVRKIKEDLEGEKVHE